MLGDGGANQEVRAFFCEVVAIVPHYIVRRCREAILDLVQILVKDLQAREMRKLTVDIVQVSDGHCVGHTS